MGEIAGPVGLEVGRGRGAVVASGAAVTVVAALGYVGYFARDVLMAREIGAGSELDCFLIAAMIAMFMSLVFALPVGGAAVPAFLDAAGHGPAQRQRFVSEAMGACLIATAGLALILLVAGPFVVPHTAPGFPPHKVDRTLTLLSWFLPVFVLSSVIVFGNALLNALGELVRPTAAQSAVSVVSIAGLLLLSGFLGVAAVIAGMLASQLVNIAVIVRILKRHGVSLRPALPRDAALLRPFALAYAPLLGSAFAVNIAAAVNLSTFQHSGIRSLEFT